MQLLSNLTYEQITTSLYNKNIHFTSDCEFFPEFDVIGKIIKTRIQNTEIVMTFKTKQGRVIDIGSHMKNLRYEILQIVLYMKTFEMKSANRQECKFDEAKKSQSKTGTQSNTVLYAYES